MLNFHISLDMMQLNYHFQSLQNILRQEVEVIQWYRVVLTKNYIVNPIKKVPEITYRLALRFFWLGIAKKNHPGFSRGKLKLDKLK